MYFDFHPDAPTVLADPVNPLAAAAHPNPYPFYRSLRSGHPFYRDGDLGLWVASDHAGVKAALGHPQLGVRPPGEAVPSALQGTAAGELFARLVRMNDGPFHAMHKSAVQSATSRFDLDGVGQASRLALARLLPRQDINGLLTALPIQVMARLLGVEETRLDEVVTHVQAFVRGIAASASLEVVNLASNAAVALQALWGNGVDAVTVANRIGFMQQSVDATAGLLGNTVHLLMRRPDLQKACVISLEATRQLVAEVARWDAPVQNTRRWAAQDVVIQGHQVAAGEGLLLLLASANRDAVLNDRPDEFLRDRPDRRSMTFGAAAHACPGDMIAIEIVACCTVQLCLLDQWDDYFGPVEGYVPLPNARIPVFAEGPLAHNRP